MLESEFKYYIDHQSELVKVKEYNNRFIVIKGNEIIGAYDTRAEAYNETIKEHKLGIFLIQYCTSGQDSYTQTYYTHRVLFN